MTRGLPARVAVVCAILGMAQAALGQVRTVVAVVDLSAEPAAATLADQLYRELFHHADLSPLDKPALVANLSGPLEDPGAARLARARAARARAEYLETQFQFAEEALAALEGQRELIAQPPDAEVSALLFELAILGGKAALSSSHANDANRSFALAHRLDPMKQLDPTNYKPDVLTAFRTASSSAGAAVKLELEGTGRVWIDGVDRGEAPGSFEVEPGPHLVQLAGAERETRGEIASAPAAIAIPDAPYSEEQLVRSARLALARAPDEAARASAMQKLAHVLGVHDAVLISKAPDGKLLVQTWRDRAPGFSALLEHGTEPPAELLAPLAPLKPPEPPHVPVIPVGPPPHHEDEPPWYRQRWVQASVAASVLGAVVGGVLWARRARDVMVDPNIQSK